MEQVLTRQRMDGNDQRDSLPSADWQPKEIEAHDREKRPPWRNYSNGAAACYKAVTRGAGSP
jgi:hypothetical protein